MVDLLTVVGIGIASAAMVIALLAYLPVVRQWRIDRDPKKHYRFTGPENGWRDLGDVGRPQLNLAIWNDRSVQVEMGVQAVEVKPGYGGGGLVLVDQEFMPTHALGSRSPASELEIPAHGHRRLLITGRTPTPGYRGDLGVVVMDGDRRVFLVYHHRSDDPPPFPGSLERNAVPGTVHVSQSGTFGERTTINLADGQPKME